MQFDNGTNFINDDLSTMSKTMSKSEIEAIEQRMQQRIEHLNSKCTELGLDIVRNDSLHKPNPWEFLVNRRHHLIW